MRNFPYGHRRTQTGIPVCKRAGIAKKFAYGDPHTHNEIVRIWGLTYGRDAKAFQCHPDKFDEAVNHAATFAFEWIFMSIFKSVPGYALEKFLNHGSRELRAELSVPEESFDEIAAELEDQIEGE